MSKKMYHLKLDLYVMADDEWEAQSLATQVKFEPYEFKVREAENVLPEWAAAVPFNSNDNLTCAEVFAQGKSNKPNANYPIGKGLPVQAKKPLSGKSQDLEGSSEKTSHPIPS